MSINMGRENWHFDSRHRKGSHMLWVYYIKNRESNPVHKLMSCIWYNTTSIVNLHQCPWWKEEDSAISRTKSHSYHPYQAEVNSIYVVFIVFTLVWKVSCCIKHDVEYWTCSHWNKHRYVCTLEELTLVDAITLLYKYKVIWNGNYTGIYTNFWIAWEEHLDVTIWIWC